MHPDLLRAVMLDRQQRLLHQGEFRGHEYLGSLRRQRPARTSYSRVRTWVGRVLVSAGSRLAGPVPNGFEFRNQAQESQSLGGQQAAVR
jgi:hypothetical protein